MLEAALTKLEGEPTTTSPEREAFRQGLRELGWIEGQTVTIKYRWAESDRVRAVVLGGVGALRSTASRTRAGPEGESDEVVQFVQIKRFVQITDGALDQRLGLLPGVPAASHHEDWRHHAKVADVLQNIKSLFPGLAVACAWRHDHVQQNEVEPLP